MSGDSDPAYNGGCRLTLEDGKVYAGGKELLPKEKSGTGRGGAYKNGDYQVDEMNIVYDEVSACFTVNLKVSWKGSGISAQTPEDGVVIRCLNPPKKEGTP